MTNTDNTTELTTQPASILDSVGATYGIAGGALYRVLAETIFPNKQSATQAEIQAFLIVAQKYDLNPMTREIWAFPGKGGGIVPIVSIDGWLKLANNHPMMDGIQAEPVIKDGQLIAYTSTIWRKDRSHPTVITETLEENKRSSSPTWRTQPHRMLRHRAIIQNIRSTFGFAGIYDPDEGQRIYEAKARVIRSSPALEKQDARLATNEPETNTESTVHPDNEPEHLKYEEPETDNEAPDDNPSTLYEV